MNQNRDDRTINNFGDEWERFNYLDQPELTESNVNQFELYLKPLPTNVLNSNTTRALDVGAGSGRWAQLLAPKVKNLTVLEPSHSAFNVLRRRFSQTENITLVNNDLTSYATQQESYDFAMSLGVLHHIPNTGEAVKEIFKLLKEGGFFLGYLYYDLSTKSIVYRHIWKISNLARHVISKLSKTQRILITELIAFVIYYPFARTAKILLKLHIPISWIPLHHYANLPLYMMRNDALDRFGTPLEQRFSRDQITEMLVAAGADPATIIFSAEEPFWTFSAQKNSDSDKHR